MPKTWIIPDIHGCIATLTVLMEHTIKPNKTDHIIFLGDYIDRGPDSKGVIDFIIQLQNQGYKITPLKGNHEESCVKACQADKNKKSFWKIQGKTSEQKNWERFGGKQTLESFDVTWPAEIPQKYIQWMDNLPLYFEDEKFIAVHAGLNFLDDDPFRDTYAMLWIRDFVLKPEKINHKTLVHGHVPVNLEVIDMTLRQTHLGFIDLDNGVYIKNKPGYGNLVTLEFEKKEYYIQTVIDEIKYDNPVF